MDFTLQSIKEAHAKFTGVDFPKLVNEFKLMGMVTNEFNLKTGASIYIDKNGSRIEIIGDVLGVTINDTFSDEVAKRVLKSHQAGETDFATFCKEIAEAGICGWITDIEMMTCSYYDIKGNIVLTENVPAI